MLSEQFGRLIARERLAQGMTQADLARSASVSRTILSRLEQGKAVAVQTNILDRILGSLGHAPNLTNFAVRDDRYRARAEHQAMLHKQRDRHLRLAIHLAADPSRARGLISRAKARVTLWEKNATCSPYYIKRWSELLALPPGRLARRMASLGEWEDALFQNSPWSFQWT